MLRTILLRLALTSSAVGLIAFGATAAAKPASPPRPRPCPATAPGRIGHNHWRPARDELAPPGASAIRLCRYAGSSASRPSSLVRSALIMRSSRVTSLVRLFDRLQPFFSSTSSCPADNGALIDARLVYPDGHRVTVRVFLGGCLPVFNGNVLRSAENFSGNPGPALLARLERLTR